MRRHITIMRKTAREHRKSEIDVAIFALSHSSQMLYISDKDLHKTRQIFVAKIYFLGAFSPMFMDRMQHRLKSASANCVCKSQHTHTHVQLSNNTKHITIIILEHILVDETRHTGKSWQYTLNYRLHNQFGVRFCNEGTSASLLLFSCWLLDVWRCAKSPIFLIEISHFYSQIYSHHHFTVEPATMRCQVGPFPVYSVCANGFIFFGHFERLSFRVGSHEVDGWNLSQIAVSSSFLAISRSVSFSERMWNHLQSVNNLTLTEKSSSDWWCNTTAQNPTIHQFSRIPGTLYRRSVESFFLILLPWPTIERLQWSTYM